MNEIDWSTYYAAIWRGRKGVLKPISHLDETYLEQLVGIQLQKQALLENTQAFLQGKEANNALLWGARGCGKSSLIKAVFHHFKDKGLRIIEIERDDLVDLLDIVDDIRDLPYRYIVFCDDLSFERNETNYRALKRVLDGSIEAKPKNTILYATSNRKHLLPEYHSDSNDITQKNDGEIHFGDQIEESIALSDRFGLNLSFYTGKQKDYLEIIDFYFKDYKGDRVDLHKKAVAYATQKGIKNARTAKQFFVGWSE